MLEADGSDGGGSSNNFLQKGFALLSSSNARIQEAVLLMLLEPMRRPQVEQSKGVNPPNTPTLSCKPFRINHKEEWLALPSLLLCRILQMHFPIVCRYICHWINGAMAGHGQMYAQSDNVTQSKCKNQPQAAGSGNDKELFRHALQRIKQFCPTSERLCLLCSHNLRLLEEEPQNVLERSVEEDENPAFCKYPSSR